MFKLSIIIIFKVTKCVCRIELVHGVCHVAVGNVRVITWTSPRVPVPSRVVQEHFTPRKGVRIRATVPLANRRTCNRGEARGG